MLDLIIIPAIIIGCLGLLFGLGLSIASKKFAVKKDKRINQISEILPGANCAACGYSGCSAYAEAVVNDGAECNLCTVGGEKVTDEISNIMGVESSASEQCVARVMCSGDYDIAKQKYEYEGIDSCMSASLMHAGQSACRFGCLGLGDCEKACPFDAIVMKNGVAKIIESKCTGCGQCIETCPKGIIKLTPENSQYSVICSNTDRGASVRKICKQGCIGCTLCVKACEKNAISMREGLAVIDASKCDNCGTCLSKCPTDAIQQILFESCDKV